MQRHPAPDHARRLTRRLFARLSLLLPASLTLVALACRGQNDQSSTSVAPASGSAGTGTPLDTPGTATTPLSQSGSPASAATSPASSPASASPAPAVGALSPTPSCTDDDDVTPSQTEGPYYTRNTPERSSLLEPGMPGTKLVLSGAVYATDCRPVARALLDFWQADDRGQYDNVGYRLRGHQFTDANGRYRLETIMPGLYPGRTRHIHVKVQAPNRPVLTTQLYFPNEPGNRTDRIFDAELVVELRDAPDGKQASFDFVLALG